MTDPLDRLGSLLGATDDAERFARSCDAVADWGAVFDAAREHELAAVLYHHVRAAGRELPAEVDRRARHESFVLAAMQRPLLGDLTETVRSLEPTASRAMHAGLKCASSPPPKRFVGSVAHCSSVDPQF
jgi:hypothetical protein